MISNECEHLSVPMSEIVELIHFSEADEHTNSYSAIPVMSQEPF
jgi:hypothetical protein